MHLNVQISAGSEKLQYITLLEQIQQKIAAGEVSGEVTADGVIFGTFDFVGGK